MSGSEGREVSHLILCRTLLHECVINNPSFLLQASALVQTQDEKKIDLLYQFLSNASEVFVEVFPLM